MLINAYLLNQLRLVEYLAQGLPLTPHQLLSDQPRQLGLESLLLLLLPLVARRLQRHCQQLEAAQQQL